MPDVEAGRSIVGGASTAPTGPRVGPLGVAATLLAIVAAFAAGVFLGIGSDGGDDVVAGPALVAEDSVDVGFSRAMRAHHAQAVEMSVMVRDATDDAQVRTLALDVLLTQQQQLGQMFAWLAAWGYPQSGTGEVMAWMPRADMAGMGRSSSSPPTGPSTLMPGMATEAQVLALGKAEGRRAARIYLQLLIPHHEAGVEMARYAVERATQPQVKQLAQRIVDAQSAELRVLRSMLQDRSGPVGNL